MGTLTIGSDTYEIYGSEAACAKYLNARLGALGTAWTNSSLTDRQKAQVMAHDLLERQSWIDSVSTFALRDAILDFQEAAYELTGSILADPTVYTAETSGKNIKKVEAAVGVSVEFFTPTLGISGRFPMAVQELIGEYLESSVTGTVSGSYSSGTSGQTTETFDTGRFDITKGLG
jgi:hypothetical protein